MRDGVFMVTAGGNYESSFAFVDAFWESVEDVIEGDPVMVVLARDLFLFTGSANTRGMRYLREVADESEEDGAYTISRDVFVRRDGAWQVSRKRSLWSRLFGAR